MMTIINMHFQNQMHEQSFFNSLSCINIGAETQSMWVIKSWKWKIGVAVKTWTACPSLTSSWMKSITQVCLPKYKHSHATCLYQMMTNCCHFANFLKSEMLRLKCIYCRKWKPYLCKKSIHFLPSQLNGESLCWKWSSCGSSCLTSMMESPLPFLSIFSSKCFLCRGWEVGCNVQHWSMMWPLLWQWLQIFCIFSSCCLCLESFLKMDFLFQHFETWWLLKPQNVHGLFPLLHADLLCLT